ncbi:type II toxin-antitoxin system Phd/YefM family antitoxin [Levilactobacillus namurensis]|uniref:type II toxin-antitoxin system Phd/YefM family antitoxin n=1 Tax=Levilactobacillus namurensis TaxID=380393 RepID=UPI0022301E8A|nr:type II toxin-antitoxin system Phd/YefM family antitoxin [Levilactobacillus namurensis]MCW3778823.1 type II toxin-antitoxin system Phd/YefM family antitoxin [Levilactobacillus namurensis]MDT7019397.1 type II toxin-antitoxin system Phd/YefM family antitoxin [Levilactobacillus namurensis]WNN66007.1 type II toxin-antitoxin system Phd/YefM family antitoxin [Levilactobacillus namurensis]
MATTAINISDARKNLKKLTDDVVDFDDHVIITKPQNRNVVVMSEKEYQSWQETLYLLSSEANRQNLEESMNQIKNQQIKSLTKEKWDRLSHEDY